MTEPAKSTRKQVLPIALLIEKLCVIIIVPINLKLQPLHLLARKNSTVLQTLKGW